MLLAQLVETSRRVASTSKRLEKIALLGELLGQVEPGEVDIAVSFLAGNVRQGRIGIGYSAIQNAVGALASAATLSLTEVDEAFRTIAGASGAGSGRLKLDLLGSLLNRATAEEQRFL
ncbi:MAG: ATP-dependent DNA ligase, partial [bacterium]|nr:ATP-dependent DNA ligase [bacterium]